MLCGRYPCVFSNTRGTPAHAPRDLPTMRSNGIAATDLQVFVLPGMSHLSWAQDHEMRNPATITAVLNARAPTTVKELRSFLGLAGYYRKFVRSYSTIAHPLHDLLRKNRKYELTTQCQEAFNSLKQALTSAPCLAFPDFTRPFTLYVDASTYGLGACLTQIDPEEGKERVITRKPRTETCGEELLSNRA